MTSLQHQDSSRSDLPDIRHARRLDKRREKLATLRLGMARHVYGLCSVVAICDDSELGRFISLGP